VAEDVKSNLEIPNEVRQLAEKSVGEAKRAFDNFIAAAQKITSSMEGQAAAVQSGSMEMHSKIRTFAERNVATCFDFAQRFIHAKNVQEVMQLQAELVKAQMQAITEQTKELADAAVKSVMDAAKPKS
jgi:phasin